MSEPFRPDPRWLRRHQEIYVALEQLEIDMRGLASLDQSHMPAVWSEYVSDAVGCLMGAKVLLARAHETRDEYLEARRKAKKGQGNEP